MNTEKLLTVQEAALAWAQGKKVEATTASGDGSFDSVSPVGSGSGSGRWNPLVFQEKTNRKFRLAQEPAPKKLRPYTREELVAQLGRRIQSNLGVTTGLLCGVDGHGNALVCGDWMSPEGLARNWQWVGGEPCGVEVDA